MQIRHAVHPEHAKTLDTDGLRQAFLVEKIFEPGQVTLTYSHIDRIIVGGAMPTSQPIGFPENIGKLIGSDHFLSRRELGLINVGGPGTVHVGAKGHPVATHEALYVGSGELDVTFSSDDASHPAKFYFNSAPAHTAYPTVKITLEQAAKDTLGDNLTSNRRTIIKYLVPDVVQTCQLLMGMTRLEPGSLWNTMPCHTHERRMEVYFYFDMAADAAIFHLMGQATETRHLVMRNEQAAISPSWSLHSGVGTQAYTFIWGMVGENQTFSDMDHIAMDALK